MIGAAVAYSHKPDISMCVEQPLDCDWHVVISTSLFLPWLAQCQEKHFNIKVDVEKQQMQ